MSQCVRCGNDILPSVGCMVCGDISDEVLARLAHDTRGARMRRRIAGGLLFAAGLVVGAGTFWIGRGSIGDRLGEAVPLIAFTLATLVGGVGLQVLERAKLHRYISPYDVQRIKGELEASTGSAESVAVPAYRVKS